MMIPSNNSTSIPIKIPLINANEPEARIIALTVSNGRLVEKDELICTLETTKSTQDLYAVREGYICGLVYKVGDILKNGAILCYIADDPNWQVYEDKSKDDKLEESFHSEAYFTDHLPTGLRITQPALQLALDNQIDLKNLPKGELITQQTIHDLIQIKQQSGTVSRQFGSNAILIYGGGGHGKSVAELIESIQSYQLVGIIDDKIPSGSNIVGFEIIGSRNVLKNYYKKGVRLASNAIGGIGDLDTRISIFIHLKEIGFSFPSLTHPTAYVEKSAQISAGVQIMPQAYIGSNVRIGFGVIVNTGAIVSHDCEIEEYVNISPGAILAGGVHVSARTLIGMGATINLQVIVGADTRIGNNATIKENVPPNSIIRAASSWPL